MLQVPVPQLSLVSMADLRCNEIQRVSTGEKYCTIGNLTEQLLALHEPGAKFGFWYNDQACLVQG